VFSPAFSVDDDVRRAARSAKPYAELRRTDVWPIDRRDGGTDWATALVIDAAGNVYVGGATTSLDFPVLNAARPVNTSTAQYPYTSADGFLARVGSSGAVYSTYVGGSDYDNIAAVSLAAGSVFVGGRTCSNDFPGVGSANLECKALVAELSPATGAVGRGVTLHSAGGGDWVNAMAVDAAGVAYVAGTTQPGATPSFPTTPDAYQKTFGGQYIDAFLSIVDMSGETPSLVYSSYLGGKNDDEALTVVPDGTGGALFAGDTRVYINPPDFPSHTTHPEPPAEPAPNQYQSFAAHVAVAPANGGGPGAEIVLHARDASPIAGAWQLVADSTAADNIRIWNPDAGAAKLASASAAPANSFELTFDAPAGVPVSPVAAHEGRPRRVAERLRLRAVLRQPRSVGAPRVAHEHDGRDGGEPRRLQRVRRARLGMERQRPRHRGHDGDVREGGQAHDPRAAARRRHLNRSDRVVVGGVSELAARREQRRWDDPRSGGIGITGNRDLRRRSHAERRMADGGRQLGGRGRARVESR
jgi:hypothetical protein